MDGTAATSTDPVPLRLTAAQHALLDAMADKLTQRILDSPKPLADALGDVVDAVDQHEAELAGWVEHGGQVLDACRAGAIIAARDLRHAGRS